MPYLPTTETVCTWYSSGSGSLLIVHKRKQKIKADRIHHDQYTLLQWGQSKGANVSHRDFIEIFRWKVNKWCMGNWAMFASNLETKIFRCFCDKLMFNFMLRLHIPKTILKAIHSVYVKFNNFCYFINKVSWLKQIPNKLTNNQIADIKLNYLFSFIRSKCPQISFNCSFRVVVVALLLKYRI